MKLFIGKVFVVGRPQRVLYLNYYNQNKELKSKMKEIQNHIYKFVASKNSDSLENEIAEVQKLKDEIYLLINRKHQEEWKKQKYEVALEK